MTASLLWTSGAHAQWAIGGNRVCGIELSQHAPAVVRDGQGGALFAWFDDRMNNATNVFVSRLTPSSDLAPGWQPGGTWAKSYTILKSDLCTMEDGDGGVYLAWTDRWYSSAIGGNQIYLYRLDGAGQRPAGWPMYGMVACAADSDQQKPKLAPDDLGGVFVVWEDRRSGTNYDIYVTRVQGDGTLAPGWPVDGMPLCSAVGDQTSPAIVPDGFGGAIIAWVDTRDGGADLYASRIVSTGSLASGWPADGALVSGASGDQGPPRLTPDGAEGAFIVWQDARGADPDLYLQRLTGAGTLAANWPAEGVPVCVAGGVQEQPVILRSPPGGVLILWQDGRDSETGLDIYAQRVDPTGSLAPGWVADGLALTRATGDQTSPDASEDDSGGAYVTWADRRNQAYAGSDIFVQHVLSSGVIASGWMMDGVPVCQGAGDQFEPKIATSTSDLIYVVWSDLRDDATTGQDIYCFRLTPDGPIPHQVGQLFAPHHDGQTFLTWNVPAGTGWTYRVYRSSQPIASVEDLGSVSFVASMGDSTWCDKRLSRAMGTYYGYCLDSLAAPLGASKGLFVVTPTADRISYYAVTTQLAGWPEDRTILPGANATLSSTFEFVAPPRPIYQRAVVWAPINPIVVEVYTLWASHEDTPYFPAMASLPGLAYDCGIVRGNAPGQPLFLALHSRGGDFVHIAQGTGFPDEWRLMPDDPLPNQDLNTWWFGYHEWYDPTSYSNSPPVNGTVHDYTLRRVVYTLLWARDNFPFAKNRVYVAGASMGAIGAVLLGLARPDLVAAVWNSVGKYDFSDVQDPDPRAGFNTGNGLRVVTDRQWGTTDMNLPTDGGLTTYERQNYAFMAAQAAGSGIPPMLTFAGKNDYVVGWGEKPRFMSAMELHRHGGYFFWDPRSHNETLNTAWYPMQLNLRYVFRYRLDQSYPALTHCSADGDMGDGSASSGDSVGTINGFVEWDTVIVDQSDRWEIGLYLRDLTTNWGTWAAPESITVDVTPRRLQSMAVVPGDLFHYEVARFVDGALVQSGTVTADSLALVTIPSVRVYRTRNTLKLSFLGRLGTEGPPAIESALSLPSNPLRRPQMVSVAWPSRGDARLELVDLSGRRARTLHRGTVAGVGRYLLEPDALPSGVYFLQATQAGWKRSAKVVVLR